MENNKFKTNLCLRIEQERLIKLADIFTTLNDEFSNDEKLNLAKQIISEKLMEKKKQVDSYFDKLISGEE